MGVEHSTDVLSLSLIAIGMAHTLVLLQALFLLDHLSLGVLGATVSSSTAQVINGIGASGAWWPNDLYNFPLGTRENVSALLFEKTNGLGLTSYRYNLGGGGIGVGTVDRAPETPYISDGVYNFSADPQGTYFLREAARYNVPILTLFVNSAPTTFTSNGENCGGTLITSRIPEYARYLSDVITYWKTQGITFTAVSTMNEPDNSFGPSPCGQEGMIVEPSQRAAVVTAVAAALKNAGLNTRVIADESSTLSGNFNIDAPDWLNSTVGADLLGIAHHQYGFESESSQEDFGELARNLSGGTPTWFTEICCWASTSAPLGSLSYGATYDPTMTGALPMANLLSESLQWIEDEHWDFWTALSNGYGCSPSGNSSCVTSTNSVGWNDGLMYYDPDYATTENYAVSLSKRYSVMRHFSQGIPVGSIRRVVEDVPSGWIVLAFDNLASASKCGLKTSCVGALNSIIVVNGQSNTSTISLAGDGTFVLTQPRTAYVTDATSDYASTTVPTLSNGSFTVDAPALSIFTIYF